MTSVADLLASAQTAFVFKGNTYFEEGDEVGYATAAGDMDGDGHVDVIIAARAANSYRGITYVFKSLDGLNGGQC